MKLRVMVGSGENCETRIVEVTRKTAEHLGLVTKRKPRGPSRSRKGGGVARTKLAGYQRPSVRLMLKAKPVRVLRNERCVKRVATVEDGVSHIADATGKHPEFIFDEVRHNRAVVNDQGDQAEWFIDDQTNYAPNPHAPDKVAKLEAMGAKVGHALPGTLGLNDDEEG